MSEEPLTPAAQRWVVRLAHAGFILIGIVNTLLGPVLPLLSGKWQLSDGQASYLFIAQFTGSIIGAAASGALLKRVGFLSLLSGSFGGMALAIGGLALSSSTAGTVLVFGYGLGLGLSIPATNLLIAEINPARRAAALNLLNFMWCVGAVASPPLVSSLAGNGDPARPLLGLAALLGCLAVFFGRSTPLDPSPRGDAPRPDGSFVLRSWLSGYMLLTGALFFVYTGTETAAGGWIASYARRVESSSGSLWALSQSLFWAGLLAGRAAAPFVLRRIRSGALVLAGMVVALAGLAMLLVSSRWTGLSAGACLAGLGLAPIFPTSFAIFTERYGSQATRLAGGIFVLASLGGALIPWGVGQTAERYGDLRIGLFVPLWGTVVMIGLQVLILWSGSRSRAALSDASGRPAPPAGMS